MLHGFSFDHVIRQICVNALLILKISSYSIEKIGCIALTFFINFFHNLLPNTILISATDGAARIFTYHLARWGFKPMSVELHQTGTIEGCCSD